MGKQKKRIPRILRTLKKRPMKRLMTRSQRKTRKRTLRMRIPRRMMPKRKMPKRKMRTLTRTKRRTLRRNQRRPASLHILSMILTRTTQRVVLGEVKFYLRMASAKLTTAEIMQRRSLVYQRA
jgi:hypothetical protein